MVIVDFPVADEPFTASVSVLARKKLHSICS
jgi:hypothetical protein